MKKPNKEKKDIEVTRLDDVTEERMEETQGYYRQIGQKVLLITQEELADIKARSDRFRIDHGRLTDEVAIQPALYAHVANYHAKAVRNLRMREMEEENAKFRWKIAKAHARIRIKRTEEKITIPDLEAKVDIDPSVIKAQEEYQVCQKATIEAEQVSNALESDKEAAYQKGHMLGLLKSNLERENKMKTW